MFSKLKAAWARMTGGRAAGESDEPDTPAIEYQGYRIRPTPYRTERQYQTAGIIEKNFPDGPKQHRFVRADTHHSKGPAPLRHRTRQTRFHWNAGSTLG
jgi:hypothetical protein